MNTEEFVRAFYIEKQDFLKEYLAENSESEVGQLIKSLNLTIRQTEIMKKVLDTSFSDIFYSILLGLDGSAAIGNLEQQPFDIFDENGNQVCGANLMGDVEALAYEFFNETD